MLTAMLAARNVLGANYDLWMRNVNSEYLGARSRLDRAADVVPLGIAST